MYHLHTDMMIEHPSPTSAKILNNFGTGIIDSIFSNLEWNPMTALTAFFPLQMSRDEMLLIDVYTMI